MDRHLNERQARMIQEIGRAAREAGIDLAAPPPPDWRGAACWAMLLLALAACLAALLWVESACGAPAPAFRGPATLDRRLEGGWSVEWTPAPYWYGEGGVEVPEPERGTAQLSRNGMWACHRAGVQYLGTWSVEDGVLLIEEAPLPNEYGEHYPSYHRVTLEEAGAGFTGSVEGGGRVALRP